MAEGRIEDILSYSTYIENGYRVDPDIEKRNHDQMFEELNDNDQIRFLKTTFDSEYMLHYMLKECHRDAYNLYKHANLDASAKSMVGVASEISINDIDKFFAKGYYLRTTDLFYLASKLTPEEYRQMIDSGNLEDLFSSKYEKSAENRNFLERRLHNEGIDYPKDLIDQNYRFIEEILLYCPDILKDRDISQYSFPEIYLAITKLRDASNRITNESSFSFDFHDVKSLMEYSRTDSLIYNVSEKEQLDIVKTLVQNKETVKDPRYVQYMVKKNRPYNTDKIEEILNYNGFCIDNILLDAEISLEDAKVKLIDALFNMDVPTENKAQFEKELIEQLFYHKKYMPLSPLHQGEDSITDRIAEILSAGTIGDFKDLLFESKEDLERINTHNLGHQIKKDLVDITRDDIVYNLQKTANEIRESQDFMVQATSGQMVKAKVLSGQSFFIATSTIMPKCSSVSNKILRSNDPNPRNTIYQKMLETEIDPHQICTSIQSDKMMAHASSALQDQELVFGFVPQKREDISIGAMYDLSTTRKNSQYRTTDRATTPRGIHDLTNGTTEEHLEKN